jgi:uncharacterized protein (DUF1330 family)
MSALWIAHVEVTDPEAYGRYAALATQPLSDHGGVVLARAARYLQLEGTERARHVVVRFPSIEAAEACYRSAAYQEALSHARGASIRDLVIVEENGGT